MKLILLTLLFVLGFVTTIHVPWNSRHTVWHHGRPVYYVFQVIGTGNDIVVPAR